jgi:hypothetical protein
MEIYTTTKTYLILNKLGNADKATLKQNIESLNYFQLAPDAVIICSNLEVGIFVETISKGVKDYGKVTILDLQADLHGKGWTNSYDHETVFDK